MKRTAGLGAVFSLSFGLHKALKRCLTQRLLSGLETLEVLAMLKVKAGGQFADWRPWVSRQLECLFCLSQTQHSMCSTGLTESEPAVPPTEDSCAASSGPICTVCAFWCGHIFL